VVNPKVIRPGKKNIAGKSGAAAKIGAATKSSIAVRIDVATKIGAAEKIDVKYKLRGCGGIGRHVKAEGLLKTLSIDFHCL